MCNDETYGSICERAGRSGRDECWIGEGNSSACPSQPIRPIMLSCDAADLTADKWGKPGRKEGTGSVCVCVCVRARARVLLARHSA